MYSNTQDNIGHKLSALKHSTIAVSWKFLLAWIVLCNEVAMKMLVNPNINYDDVLTTVLVR
jgi:hypothetical protein